MKQPKGQEFTGHSSELKKDSPWLASEDLIGRGDVAVTISHCERFENVEFDQGRVESKVFSLCFVGKSKRLILNSTNRKSLVSKFGTNVQDWKGKEVKLYVDPNVKMMGKVVPGIRIR